jgi:hypothetical protein
MEGVYNASGVALAVFMALGALDGLYLHLWRYRLHARPASRAEHRLHTLTAALFLATLPALFLWETGGWLLWAGVALFALELVVSLFDMGIERRSRADLGGLSTLEYILHVVVTSARGAAVALALAARPSAAWSWSAPAVVGALPGFAAAVAWQALPGAVLAAALHVWLCTSTGVSRFEGWRRLREARSASAAVTSCCATTCCGKAA